MSYIDPSSQAFATFFAGETFVDGQERIKWCNSKIQVTDSWLHPTYISNDAYERAAKCSMILYSLNIVPNKATLFVAHDVCRLSALINFNHNFLCE